MKRKTSTLPTRILSYGCQSPTLGAEIVKDQIWKAHRYYNKLIEIDLERRRLYREARSSIDGKLRELESAQAAVQEEIDKERAALQLTRQSKRKRVADPVAVATLRALQTQRKAYSVALKEARLRAKSDPALLAASERINEQSKKKLHEARATCGVYWGTYLLVEAAVQAACKPGPDPEFRRWAGGQGRVGVQLHREQLSAALEGRGTMIQFLPHGTPKGPCWSKSGLHAIVRIRVGSDAQKKPVWAEFPVKLHRFPPPDAVLTWAWIHIRKQGPTLRYELQLVVESETFHERRCGKGVVALDLGWRVLPNGDTRVGYIVDGDGHGSDLLLPRAISESLDGSNALRGISDRIFDSVRQVFQAWLVTATGPAAEWWREETRFMPKWRSHAKLARVAEHGLRALSIEPDHVRELWKKWQADRKAAGLDLFDTFSVTSAWFVAHGMYTQASLMVLHLEWWRRKDVHLYTWECNQRTTALRRRKHIYRNIAASLASKYEFLVLEEFDLRAFARNAQPEEETTDFTHRARTVAGPSALRLAILGAWDKKRTFALPAVDTTRECHLCHYVNKEWGDPAALMQGCAGCGAYWDQDDNAARVLLHRWREGSGDGKSQGGARGSISAAGSGAISASLAPPPGE